MLLDKVTCLTSALFLFLSLSICRSSSSSSLLLLFFFSNCFLEQDGGGGVERRTVGGRDSALYILIFSVRRMTVPLVCELIEHRLSSGVKKSDSYLKINKYI